MFLVVVLLFLHSTNGEVSSISCYNDDGDSVDWFYLYKLPHGVQYLLMERGSERWIDGKVDVNDSTGTLGRTVGQLYKQRKASDVAYILYNDQKPMEEGDKTRDDEKNERGHTKGVVLLDKKQGFWLVHSTPHFPPSKEGAFSYPDSGAPNGQNFLCVTYPLERFQTIGEQLQINQPSVYDCDVPDSLASLVPSIAELCRSHGDRANVSFQQSSLMANRSVSLTSLAGTEFTSFAKGESFGHDLYHSWVAPTLQSNLLVQFWRRSTGILPSDCSEGWKVLDLELISPAQGIQFKSTEDHSKWAVSESATEGWVCVGDINRNEAEEWRGGGTVCLHDSFIWKAYRMAALQCYSCSKKVIDCDDA